MKKHLHAVTEPDRRTIESIRQHLAEGRRECLFACGREIQSPTHLRAHLLANVLVALCQCGHDASTIHQVTRHKEACLVSSSSSLSRFRGSIIACR